MTLDWIHFTPWSAALGGILLGLGVALLLLANGRIAGISGIAASLLRPWNSDSSWRLAFLAGLILAPILYKAVAGLPPIQADASWPMLVLAGLLVGIGTRYGSGCTSGHGICGLSRLSPRSLAATLTFMAAGFATVYILRHVLGG